MESSTEWLDSEFITKVQKRGAEIISMMQKSSAASAANAVCDHVRDLFHGTEASGRKVSMAVTSDGNSYGVPEGLIYSFPCVIKAGGEWSIANDLPINDFQRERMTKSAEELQEEKTMALGQQ